jgi:hypothetical protein
MESGKFGNQSASEWFGKRCRKPEPCRVARKEQRRCVPLEHLQFLQSSSCLPRVLSARVEKPDAEGHLVRILMCANRIAASGAHAVGDDDAAVRRAATGRDPVADGLGATPSVGRRSSGSPASGARGTPWCRRAPSCATTCVMAEAAPAAYGACSWPVLAGACAGRAAGASASAAGPARSEADPRESSSGGACRCRPWSRC